MQHSRPTQKRCTESDPPQGRRLLAGGFPWDLPARALQPAAHLARARPQLLAPSPPSPPGREPTRRAPRRPPPPPLLSPAAPPAPPPSRSGPSAHAACPRISGPSSQSARASTGTASGEPQLPSATATLRSSARRLARFTGEPLKRRENSAWSIPISSISFAPCSARRGQDASSLVIWTDFGPLCGQTSWLTRRLTRSAIPLGTGRRTVGVVRR
jgi:hypothetical protein